MSRPRIPYHPLTPAGRVLWVIALAVFSAALMLFWSPAHADDIEARKSESPYFAVRSSEPGVDRLPLKSTKVDVRIVGVIADVTVTQHYRNEGQRPIEARYLFPGSTQSAVHAMTVRLGDRVLTAQIKEKEQARIEYQTARREGKTAALLEQKRPNVFEMNVANILPGDDVAVELRYTELLTPTEAVYGFVFPTVVGPRYNSPGGTRSDGAPNADPIGGAYLRAGAEPPSAFDLRVTLDSPVAVKEIASTSHAIQTDGVGTSRATVALATGQRPANDRDFILHYRLAGDRIESGITMWRAPGEMKPPSRSAPAPEGRHPAWGGPAPDGGENFFLAMVEPPRHVPTRQINPRDYIFVVDVSGSMHGHPLSISKELLRDLIGGLRPSDTFNVMLFSGASRMLSPGSVPATPANIAQALRTIDGEPGGGGTEIMSALRHVAALPKPEDVSRSVIVITDGYVSVEAEVFRHIRSHLDQTNVFAFGIGSAVNRHLIEGIARAGQGEAFIVTKREHAAAQATRLRKIIEAPVLTSVKARFEGVDAYDVEPAVLPDVMAGRPVVLFGKWRGAPATGSLVIEGRSAEGPWQQTLPLAGRDGSGPATLRQLWARQRIAALSDQEALEGGGAQKKAITELGLTYHLLTSYTSFIAVDERVRSADPAAAAAVDQPLPLPEGVGETAIGAQVPSTPEPAAMLALLAVAGVLAATVLSWRRKV